MADAAAPEISTDASSIPPATAHDSSTIIPTSRKGRISNFLKPESPRKRRRSGDSSPLPADPSTPVSPKFSVSPPTLTAAQALLDQRSHKQSREAFSDRQTSPNSARIALLALQGRQMISEKGSENASTTVDTAGEPMTAPVSSNSKPEAPQIGVAQMQQNSTPPSSFGPVENSMGVTITDSNNGPVASPGRMDEGIGNDEEPEANPNLQRPRRQETDPGESRSDKALTYPGPLPNFSQVDRRRNTHSGFGRDSESKSPSAKKHQCESLPVSTYRSRINVSKGPYCSTTFTRHHNLKSHLLTHSHEKPYYCETCESRFRRLHDLKRHSKLHTGERPHTCPKCHRSFARGDALARHSKGAGGCAGRRSSLGGDEADQDETMHGEFLSSGH
ncbi:MAG: hypothetical protein Q9219_001244 [cf. Caloplaca sp. 3 TL-2023]